MHSKDFFPTRYAELRKFFELRFGPGWHQKIAPKITGWLTSQPKRVTKAEVLARLHGFIPNDENPRVQALERNFLSRLRAISDSLGRSPQAVCYTTTFKHVLDEFFAHRPHRSKHKRKHKDAHSDVICRELLMIEQPEQRTCSPTSCAPGAAQAEDQSLLDSWLTIPIGEPPGPQGPEGGKVGPPISLSGSSETCIESRVADYEI